MGRLNTAKVSALGVTFHFQGKEKESTINGTAKLLDNTAQMTTNPRRENRK